MHAPLSSVDTKEGKVSYVWEKFSRAIDFEELIKSQKEVVGPQGAEQRDMAGGTTQ